MDNSVVIKGSKDGITVLLDSDLPFDELLACVSEKFKNASTFFGNANMAVSFNGRDLSLEEEKQILDKIAEVSDMNIVCVMDNGGEIRQIREAAVKKAIDGSEELKPKPQCMFYKGTLRSGQVFEADGSVVVLGDVNPGGKVVAKGNIIVLGSLKGNVFAGVDGNENAFVAALEMHPMQIKIGNVIARIPDSDMNAHKNKATVINPKIAYVYDQDIYLESIAETTFEDINI